MLVFKTLGFANDSLVHQSLNVSSMCQNQFLVHLYLKRGQVNIDVDFNFFRELGFKITFGPSKHEWLQYQMQFLDHFNFEFLVLYLAEIEPFFELALTLKEFWHKHIKHGP